MVPRYAALLVVLFAIPGSAIACGGTSEDVEEGDNALSGTCTTLGAGFTTIATAEESGEHVLTLPSESASVTSWGVAGNEAVVLDIYKNDAFVSHVILHQGNVRFSYQTFTGELAQGDVIKARVSARTASKAAHGATVCSPTLTPASTLGAMGDAVAHSPIYVRPAGKAFDDVPLIVGYSKRSHETITVLTNENGGTTELCGGGADGLAKEILFWGRGADIEGSYNSSDGSFERCTGKGTLHYEGTHPFLYHGDGHNRMFEDRSGYGATCGDSAADKPDGNFPGWGQKNPSPSDDLQYSIILRPVPVDFDAIAYHYGAVASRERIIAQYAPWLLRLTGLETAKEGKVDNKKTFTFDRYLHADVYVMDVGGSSYTCLPFGLQLGGGGFALRTQTKGGKVDSNGVITKAVCGDGWKHVAIPLDEAHSPADFDQIIFDAYDGDGIYLAAIGDVYVLQADGVNGAKIASVRTGDKPLGVYVDDDDSGCTNGANTRNGVAYACKTNFFSFAP